MIAEWFQDALGIHVFELVPAMADGQQQLKMEGV
jgi:hypothetical protein